MSVIYSGNGSQVLGNALGYTGDLQLANPETMRVSKRTGLVVSYDPNKILNAVTLCLRSVEIPETEIPVLAMQVRDQVDRILRVRYHQHKSDPSKIIGIEDIQDLVEMQLMALKFYDAAKHYILYREERRKAREETPDVPEEIKQKFKEGMSYFKGLNPLLQQTQAIDKFSRFREEWGRREVWPETCDRVMDYFKKHAQEKFPDAVDEQTWKDLHHALLHQEATCSMRAVQMAGPALERCQSGVYNCASIDLDSPESLSEDLYLLMQGCGLGFSVEECVVDKWPRVQPQRPGKPLKYTVEDDTEGWCDALKFGIYQWLDGHDVEFDTSHVRKKNAILRTKGGRASGPGPLRDNLNFCRNTILQRQGKKLRSIDIHDMACMTHRIGQMGGVRRASGLSHSDLDDPLMRDAKRGYFFHTHPWRDQANNCLPAGTWVYTERGCIPIEQVQIGDTVITPAGRGRVLSVVATGIRETVKISHALGEMECTPEHRVAVFDTIDRWVFKSASELTRLDALVFDAVGYDGYETALPVFSEEGVNSCGKDVVLPPLTTELSWFIGVFHGDGYTSLGRGGGKLSVACPVDQPRYVERLIRVFESFGLDSKVSEQRSSWGRCNTVTAHSAKLVRYFREHIKRSHESLVVPQWVMQGTREIRSAYLSGLIDTDGSTLDTSVELVASVYLEFLRQVRIVAASLGIAAKLRVADKGRNGSQPVHKLVVYGVENRAKLDELVGRYSEKYKVATPPFPKRSICEFAFPMHVLERSSIVTTYMSGELRPVSSLKREGKLDKDLVALPCLVDSVVYSGRNVEVYDLEVEGIAQFTADGMVVHNSAVYDKKPSALDFMEEWMALARSGSGERGIFNRHSLPFQIPSRRKKVRFLTNPCGEIINRANGGFCNLTIAVVNAWESLDSLLRKVRLATIWGTMQASMTRFRYIRDIWRLNAEEEALLGVDILGHMDCNLLWPWATGREWLLNRLKREVNETNREWAPRIGINLSAASTCGKPSGDSSVFFDKPAGLKPHHGRFYLRRLRFQPDNPAVPILKKEGVPWEEETYNRSGNLVFEFPCRTPEGSPILGDMTAIEQLENWKVWKKNYAEHSMSCTVYVKENEWLETGNWVYQNWEDVSGLSFFPYNDSVYPQAPYETITEAEYEKRMQKMPKEIDWSQIVLIEKSDHTTLAGALACTGPGCDA